MKVTQSSVRTQSRWVIAVACLVGACTASAQPVLERGFGNPPDSAKPRVWWHWMNGNVTKEGIQADLEWMHRIGIGGFQNFDAGLATPQIVAKRLMYMTPEWKDAFRFATELADELNLEMAIAASPGWSETGGPWVTPEQGMKKYVWSETLVEGGQPFTGVLPHPPTMTGPFQDISGGGRGFEDEEAQRLPEFYADAAVIAFRAPDNEHSLMELQPRVTASVDGFEPASLTDGDLESSIFLPAAPAGEKSWVQFEFADPVTIKSLSAVIQGGGGGPFGGGGVNRALEASDDGSNYRVVASIPGGGDIQRTIAIPSTAARYFRFTFAAPPDRPPNSGGGGGGDFGFGGGGNAPAGVRIAELALHPIARVNRFEEKAAFSTATDLDSSPTPSVEAEDAIRPSDVIDLTSRMQPDGVLDWTPPAGRWVVLRFGYSLTGRQNRPASPEATGLEVDKLNPEYVRDYFENYLGQYEEATDGLIGERGLQYVITDSWEAGTANWTDNMIDEFNRHRGYDMRSWMPVLTGRVVESAESSDRFLWDFRITLGEMVAEYHYDVATAVLHERGMGRYSESHEGGRAFIGDGMAVKRTADVPMSATWVPGGFGGDPAGGVAVRFKADVRESASVAHVYGQNLVAAESMTAIGNTWAFSPERLKPTADMELASGLNRFVIHTSVHQPVNDKVPGLGLGPFGQWFTRHETWAEQAKPWITYLARSSFMLQQGRHVADVAYLYGEDKNVTALFGNQLPPVPEGFEFDFVNADALVHVLSVRDRRIVTPSGMSYRILALDPSTQRMSLPVLKKIREMVYTNGATVVGPKPIESPSLSDDQAEFQAIADELFGDAAGRREVGRGTVFAGQTIAGALAAMNVLPDFEYTKPQEDTEILFVHRRLDDAEIYWLNSRNSRVENIEAKFRVEGKAPEVWYPDTGMMQPAEFDIADGRTTVPLRLAPEDAVFVVFREDTELSSRVLPVRVETTLAEVGGPWQVRFQANRGAPAMISLDELASWSDQRDAGVKYFSGTGSYFKTLQAPDSWFETDAQLWLDLGDVENLAEVRVNGESLGVVWKSPFRVNVTEALKRGENTLEIDVTNLWVNRLIGDQQPDAAETYTYTTQAFYQPDSPLLPSGLLGPVQVVRSATN